MKTLTTMVSTMNNDKQLIHNMNLEGQAVIVNQTNCAESFNLKEKKVNVKWINSSEKGLSKSRNKCLKETTSSFALIADDDLEYFDGYSDLIIDSFNKNPDVDILIFQVNDYKKTFKNYRNKAFNVGYLRSLKVSSVQIAFRVDSIKKNNIKFNELFGSGSTFSMGEENIFLFDCLNKNLKIKYIPKQIAWLSMGNSTWFEGYNQKYLHDRGASYAAMGKFWSHFLIIQFAIRKRNLFKSFNFFKIIKIMYQGKQSYEKITNSKIN